MDLIVATNNDHKRRELAQILARHRILVPAEVGLEFDYEETGETFLENALGKAEALRKQLLSVNTGSPAMAELSKPWAVIADDSGLCVHALGGRPGIYSARYGSPIAGKRDLIAEDRNALLLDELAGVTDRRAYFVCCMVALLDKDRFLIVQERWDGEIATTPSAGRGGFGYDPVFYIPALGLTAADLPDRKKNRLSHRGKAACRLAQLLQSNQT